MLSTLQSSLHERALLAAERYRVSHSELLSVIIEVDEARLFQAFGLSSTYAYCLSELHLTEDVACSFIAVARKARRVPELKEAVEAGLDFTKAKQVARVITPENQETLLSIAKESSCRELERKIVKEHPRAAVVEQVRLVAEDRHKLELGLSEELLKQFRRAQDLVCNKANKAASLEETLAALLSHYLAKEDPVQKAEKVRERPARANPAAEKIPATSLHAVRRRDLGRCQSPGCQRTRWIEIHHRVPRAQGGSHDPDNLVTLCGYHHRQHHREYPSRGG
jgi:5-methylcytosine-specific restriction endonuclease McrA